MKCAGSSMTALRLMLTLGSCALAANVVQMTITKANPDVDVLRQDLSEFADEVAHATIQEGLANNITRGSYMADVTVGTPGQKFSLVIDTGSSDVFVLAKTADQCNNLRLQYSYGSCYGGTFDPSQSSTYKTVAKGLFQIKYADQSGSTGDYFSDTFQIGGATVSGLQMGLALNTTVGVGIMGIGYQTGESVTAKNRYPNLIDQLAAQKLINLKAYSLWLNDKETTEGSVLFGGIDTEKFIGQLKVIPVVNDANTGTIRSFTVYMTSLSITDDSGRTSTLTPQAYSIPVVLDSGTTISYVPKALLDSIITQLGAVDDTAKSGYIFVDCNWRITRQNEYFSFGFGGDAGAVINVPISEVIRPLRKGVSGPFPSSCVLGIKSSVKTYILGDTFLRSAYLVYDLDHNQVGLAQTNFEATGSNVQEIPSGATGIPLLSGKASGATRVPQSHFATSQATATGSGTIATSKAAVTTASGIGLVTGGGVIVTETGTGTGSPASTTQKSGVVGRTPAFERGGLIVFTISLMFALAGRSWFLA